MGRLSKGPTGRAERSNSSSYHVRMTGEWGKKEARGRKGRAEEITERVIVRGGSQGTEQRGISHGGLKMSRAAGPAGSSRTRHARRSVL